MLKADQDNGFTAAWLILGGAGLVALIAASAIALFSISSGAGSFQQNAHDVTKVQPNNVNPAYQPIWRVGPSQ